MVEESSARVVNLNDFRSTQPSSNSAADDGPTLHYRAVGNRRYGDAAKSDRETDFGDLYGHDTPAGGPIVRARELLAEMASHASTAQMHLAAKELLDADQEINLIQADLPELFCLRELSQGLATVTVALNQALQNRGSGILNDDQLYAVRRSVETLRDQPFLSFDAALDLVDDLVRTGLTTEPPEGRILGEIFASA